MAVQGPIGILILNILIFVVVFSTGGLSSTLFPLLYILPFGIAFVLPSFSLLIFLIIASILFLFSPLEGSSTSNLIKIVALYLITPMAFFLMRLYKRQVKEEKKIGQAVSVITKDVDEILKKDVDEKTTEKLDEILEETEELRQETK